jgi:small subunit ribosomal protein S1
MTEANAQPSPDLLAAVLEESLKKDKARKFRKGDRVKGTVRRITDQMAFIDLGGATEGLFDLGELRRSDGTLDLEEGQAVEGIVVDVAVNGVLLKRALVPMAESVQQLKAAMDAGLPVQAKVVGANKGGLELELFGLRGFCPGSHVEVRKVDDFSSYVGQTHTFALQEVSSDGKRIVLSRRALMQADHDREVAEVRARLQVGATLKGIVTRVQPFGAFVDLGAGIEGLCHVSELTRARIHDAHEVVKVGGELEVTVLKREETVEKGRKVERIALSHKAFETDPWAGAVERFPVGSKVSGKVVRLQPFGAFIEVAHGLDGLAHVSALADKRIEHPSEVLKVGDSVEAWVLAVEPEKQRLSLSVKEPRKVEPRGERPAPKREPGDRPRPPRRPRAAPPEGGVPADGEAPSYRVGQVFDATVEKVEPFGVFATLPGGGRVLIPNNELGIVKNADQRLDYRKFFAAGATMRIALTEAGGRGLKGSVSEAQRADERAMVKEWTQAQQPETGGGRKGFGTFADLFKKANL